MFRKIAVLGLAAVAMAASDASAQAVKEKDVTVVLVHGAFVDGSGWQPVYDRLTKIGYQVIVVQNPTITLDGDVEATKNAIANARHPVVLVGHSYGGTVITQAGNDPKVVTLAYIAAFVPDTGESVETLSATPVPGAPPVPVLPPQNGFLTLDPEKFPHAFGADVNITTARFMAASQQPWGFGAFGGKIAAAAWKAKPSFYLVASDDLMIPPVAQRMMAGRAGAKVSEVKSSHAVMLSHPDAVVTFIEATAKASK